MTRVTRAESQIINRLIISECGVPLQLNIGHATATDAQIARYVTDKLRKIQAKRFGMPGLSTATDGEINDFVMGNLTKIRTNALDALTEGMIQRLPLSHRLQNFRSDIPAWLEKINNSVTSARCNKFQRSEHILRNFGIHAEVTLTTYLTKLNQSCGNPRPNAMADHVVEAKILHLTRNPFPLEDLIHAAINSNTRRNNDDMVATLRARSSIRADLLFIDRICTWIYWTAMQQKKTAAEKLPKA